MGPPAESPCEARPAQQWRHEYYHDGVAYGYTWDSHLDELAWALPKGFDVDDFKKARDYILRVMREAKLRKESTVHELMDRSNPTDRSSIEEYLDAASLTEEHTILELLAAMQMTDVPPESD